MDTAQLKNNGTILINENLEHLTSLALICTGNNDNIIVFLYM